MDVKMDFETGECTIVVDVNEAADLIMNKPDIRQKLWNAIEEAGRIALPPQPPSMWYGLCTYWTDDWDKLNTTPPTIGRFTDGPLAGIPCCPFCGAPGFVCTVAEWEEGVAEHDKKEPGYKDFINEIKETCSGRGVTIMSLWAARKETSS